jgi:hypothetical protein
MLDNAAKIPLASGFLLGTVLLSASQMSVPKPKLSLIWDEYLAISD